MSHFLGVAGLSSGVGAALMSEAIGDPERLPSAEAAQLVPNQHTLQMFQSQDSIINAMGLHELNSFPSSCELDPSMAARLVPHVTPL